ncbi:MAG: hypothetical protein ACXW4H_01875 [Candidatus Limnocylindrales bacterium]
MLIGEAVLRSNPGYELVLLDRLEPHERERITEEADGRHVPYGLLRPTEVAGLEPRVVSVDTALLFLTLTVPGPCPGYVSAGLGDRLAASLGRLVLDGILQVEVDGEFRSGAAGWAPLEANRQGDRGGGRTAELSEEAMRYGQALVSLASVPAELVASRLYMYGRRPVTPTLRRLVTPQWLLGDASATLRRAWTETPQRSADSPWQSWQRSRPVVRRLGAAVSFKLYVSPTTETLPAAIAAVATALADARGVTGFKVGRTVDGVARPDKLVAYFSSLEELHEGARRVRGQAADCRPLGVPFTAGVSGDGLLSWAIDPPHRSTDRTARSSWRTWVTMRLAEYLLDARAGGAGDPDGGEAWQVALARLALDGVDTTSWVPDPQLFDYAAAG